ncbi:hypothetical protein niasHS_016068 [Heterodera schachtii]|uniref:Uncharacterized protein n=1 Tax=Heterodera schachtii TaxID=97005 RepID=A0ABD2I488_HETSC
MLLVFLLLFSSVFTEKKCLTPTELFNSLIVGMSSSSVFSNDDQLGSNSSSDAPQNLPRIEMPLANAQMLQQWVGQVAQQIVVEDDTFAGHYSCIAKKRMENVSLSVGLIQELINSNWQLLEKNYKKLGKQKFHFLKMLFEFAALLSAEIGQQSFKESSFTRIFLKAYQCVADEKFIGNEKDFLPFSIVSKIKGPIDELNIEKILLEMQSEKETKSGLADGHLQIRKDFALLSALNIEMTAGDVLEFASFVHALLNVYTKSLEYNLYMLDKMDSNTRNLFEKRFLDKNGLTIENIGQDPVKYRRIVYQLLIGLRNWDQNDLKKISEERYYQIELTMREKCVFGIFTSNLMGRMANYELLHEYFGEIKSAGLPGIVQMEQEFFEKLSKQNCNISKNGLTDKQMEDGRIYLHLDEAIQIEWNIWKEIIQKIDEINEKINRKQEKEELVKFLEGGKYKDGMSLIKAQLDEKQFEGLELIVEKKKIIGIELEVMPKKKIKEFCGKLAEIKQKNEQNIEKYEIQRNIVIKQKENYANFYDFLIMVAENFGGNIAKNENDDQKLQIDLNGANALLDKMYELAKIMKSGEELSFKNAIKKNFSIKMNENLKKLLNQFEETNKFIKNKFFLEAQLFNLLFSFAVRLEAIVHGKKENGTIKEENAKKGEGEKIQIFLALLGKFNLPEWANNFSIFDCWMETNNLKENESSISVGIQIYRKLYEENDKALAVSRGNFKMLKRINEQKFSIYETTNLLRTIFDVIDSFRYTSSDFATPEISQNLVDQINSEYPIKKNLNYYVYSDHGGLIRGCEYVKLFQNISKKFMKMMTKKGIDPQKHFDWLDNRNQRVVAENYFPNYCAKLKKGQKADETKIALLNNVRYDLVMQFEFNRSKDIYDRTVNLLLEWVKTNTYDEENSEKMIENIYYFTRKTNKEKIAKIEELKKEEKDELEIGKNFDELEELVRKIKEELEKAKEELKKLEKEKRGKEKITRKKINELERQFKEQTEKLRNLAKSFGEMLEELKKHYEEKKEERSIN